jgi:UDP-glucose 4-epimerase
MKILVLGGAGFLGSELVNSLAKVRSNQIQVVDIFTHGFPKKAPKKKNIMLPISGNVCNYYDVARAMERFKPDTVIHLASFNSRPETFGDFISCATTNYVGTANVAKACMAVRPKKLIFASTLAAEEQISHFGISKYAAENLLISIFPRFPEIGVNTTILRFGEIYGHSLCYSSTSLVNFLADNMVLNNDIALHGVNKQIDCLHISDAVEACRLAVDSNATGIMDVGTGQGIVIKDLVNKIKELTKYQGRLRFLESDRVIVCDYVANPTNAKKAIGFECVADLDEQLRLLVNRRRKVL